MARQRTPHTGRHKPVIDDPHEVSICEDCGQPPSSLCPCGAREHIEKKVPASWCPLCCDELKKNRAIIEKLCPPRAPRRTA